MKCFRCPTEIPNPNIHNAFYVIADDAKTPEGGETAIICRKCLRPTDFVIWGAAEVIDVKEGIRK